MKKIHFLVPLSVLFAFASNPVFAALSSLSDEDLSQVNGQEGISIALKDVQVVTENQTTLNVGLDSKSLSLSVDKLRIYKQGATTTETITAGSGFNLGSGSDPILIDIEKDLAAGKSWQNTDINFLSIKLPTAGTASNKTLNQAGVSHAVQNNIAGSSAFSGVKNYATHNDSMVWKTVPFRCDSTTQDCMSIAMRIRMDLFKTLDDPNSAYKPDVLRGALVDRDLLWVKAEGVNLNGTKVRVWGDPDDGIAFTADVTAYIESLHITSKSNQGSIVAPSSSDLVGGTSLSGGRVMKNGVDTGETLETLAKTAPYSDDDKPIWTDANGKNTGLKLKGVHVDAHIGRMGYQPISVQTVVTAKNRAKPVASGAACAGGAPTSVNGYCPDDVTSDIRLMIRELPNDKAIYEDFYASPKSNIYVENAQIDDYNLGAFTVEGLQIQSLKLTTRDLVPLGADKCPSGWSCSFAP